MTRTVERHHVHDLRQEILGLLRGLWTHRAVLYGVTWVELRKKYSGSILGLLWLPLYTGLLLAMYSFVYLVVFQVRYKDFGSFDYVLFIFSGLLPYIGFSEAVSVGATSVKQNIHLVKNAVFPVELIPVKHVLAAMASVVVSLTFLLILSISSGYVGLHLLWLPLAGLALLLFAMGLVWALAGVAVLIPDVQYLVNILLLFFLFISPIGFAPDQVPESFRWVIYVNPMTYLIDEFRFALLGLRSLPIWSILPAMLGCLIVACLGGLFFQRLRPVFADLE